MIVVLVLVEVGKFVVEAILFVVVAFEVEGSFVVVFIVVIVGPLVV